MIRGTAYYYGEGFSVADAKPSSLRVRVRNILFPLSAYPASIRPREHEQLSGAYNPQNERRRCSNAGPVPR